MPGWSPLRRRPTFAEREDSGLGAAAALGEQPSVSRPSGGTWRGGYRETWCLTLFSPQRPKASNSVVFLQYRHGRQKMREFVVDVAVNVRGESCFSQEMVSAYLVLIFFNAELVLLRQSLRIWSCTEFQRLSWVCGHV